MNSGQGFTLIELVVTMMVAGVLIGVAVPSYRTLMVSNRLSATANDYVAALSEARMDAIRRNSQTQFCGKTGNGSDTLGASCGSAAGKVTTLNSAGNAIVVRDGPEIGSDLTLKSLSGLRYGGQGLARLASSGGAPYSGLIADFWSTKIDTRNRRCIYLATGSSITTCAITNTTTCPSSVPNDCQ